MISLNGSLLDTVGRVRLERLLATYNLEPTTIASLIDSVLDYRDTDDFRRINGAEKEEYAAAGKGGFIRNAELLAPTEIVRILCVSGRAELWGDDPLTNHVNTLRSSLFNPNSAGWRDLVAATGITEEMARNAAKLAGLDAAIQTLPNGYDTVCTDGMFSQGEWQLLSIARAAAAWRAWAVSPR